MLYPPDIHKPKRDIKVVLNETIKIENTSISTIFDKLQELISRDDYKCIWFVYDENYNIIAAFKRRETARSFLRSIRLCNCLDIH